MKESRTALGVAWMRALHQVLDCKPLILEDEPIVELLGRYYVEQACKMQARFQSPGARLLRSHVVLRSRFTEDRLEQALDRGVEQFVILGAGYDTFFARQPEWARKLRIFEIDQPGPQAWKRRRLVELGYGIPEWLHLVPVDFEANAPWWEQLAATGFDPGRPTVIASTGVTMYLTKDATAATLRRIAGLAPGSTLAMTFLLPTGLLDDADRPGLRTSEEGARAAGT